MRGRKFINKYLDRITADALSEYSEMEYKAGQTRGREQYLSMTEASGPKTDSVRVQGGNSSMDEKMIRAIEGKDEELDAIEYLDWMDCALAYLDMNNPDDAFIIRTYYMNTDKDIRTIQRYFHVERSAAYDRARRALRRMSRLLYW